ELMEVRREFEVDHAHRMRENIRRVDRLDPVRKILAMPLDIAIESGGISIEDFAHPFRRLCVTSDGGGVDAQAERKAIGFDESVAEIRCFARLRLEKQPRNLLAVILGGDVSVREGRGLLVLGEDVRNAERIA